MKKVLSCLLAVILSAIGLAGCGAGGNAGGEDVQRLSQVEVYSADGNLLGTVTDEDTLLRFSGLDYTDISSDTDAEMDILESKTGDLKVLHKGKGKSGTQISRKYYGHT